MYKVKSSNVWSVLRVLLVVGFLLYIIDNGVDARKHRRNKNKNKRITGKKDTDGKLSREARRHRRMERRARHRKNKIADIDMTWTQPTLIQLFEKQRLRAQKTPGNLNSGFPSPRDDGYTQSHMIKQLRDKIERERSKINNNNIPTEPANIPDYKSLPSKFHLLVDHAKGDYDRVKTPSEFRHIKVHTGSGKFGIHSKSENVFGRLIHLEDIGRRGSHFGCGIDIENKHKLPDSNETWIALISRGHCPFFNKIRLAELLNASGVVIYDNNENSKTPEMFTLGTDIVSVAIPMHDGLKAAKLIEGGANVMINITVSSEEEQKPSTTTSDGLLIRRIALEAKSLNAGNGALSNLHGLTYVSLLLAFGVTTFLQRQL